MKIKRILLTGDDGYRSIGIRLLVAVLKDRYDLKIAATVGQMSGVGGHLSLKNGAAIGSEAVDGVEALRVDGYPVDAIDAAQGYFRTRFDLVISGINMGANVSGSLITSGTFAAAFRSITVGIAPVAIAMSLHTLPSHTFRIHDGSDSLDGLTEYPGIAARRIIDTAAARSFWGAKLLNVNFPDIPTETVKVTKTYPRITGYYKYPVNFSPDRKHFTYPYAYAGGYKKISAQYDCGAISRGYISLTPCHESMLHKDVLAGMKDRTFRLHGGAETVRKR
jgi:5'-nucleotidase